MRKMFRTITMIGSLGVLAPLAAHAGNAGLHMYQPSPLIVTSQQPQHARTAMNVQARPHVLNNNNNSGSDVNG